MRGSPEIIKENRHVSGANAAHAWITGASTGLGRALALKLSREGWHITATARDAEKLEALALESPKRNVEALPLDVTDRSSVSDAVGRLAGDRPIDLAVLNAGTHSEVHVAKLSADTFRGLVELNLMGTVNCLEAILPPMLERRSGHIAIVASVAGYRGLPTAAAYGMTKAGLINMAEALQPELAQHGIKLQIVNPGFVRTPLTDRNTFNMPFLMEADAAAEAFHRGLMSDRFEIVFPRRFAYLMKLLRLLPNTLALRLTGRLVASR